MWDKNFKNVLKIEFASKGLEVMTEHDSPTVNRRFDFSFRDINPKKNISPFSYGLNFVYGEFKSSQNTVFTGDILMLHSKAFSHIAVSHGYEGKSSNLPKININKATAMLILGGGQDFSNLETGFTFEEIDSGIYQLVEPKIIHTLVIFLDEIVYTENNSFLRIFGNKELRTEYIRDAIKSFEEGQPFNLGIALDLYEEEVIKLAATEAETLKTEAAKIREYYKLIGWKNVLKQAGNEEIEKLKKAIAEIEQENEN